MSGTHKKKQTALNKNIGFRLKKVMNKHRGILLPQLERNHIPTGKVAIMLYCISTSTSVYTSAYAAECFSPVMLVWRVLRSNATHSQRSTRSEPHLTELLAAETGGIVESQTSHVTLHCAFRAHWGDAVLQCHVAAWRSRLITAFRIR